ncbi:CoA-binding domain protein [Thermobaculum terrenum ATCC BAA-798]|uniref:Redox-sensing transcriptional repressor Rex n=1 Tax=Thermobaculum terrenum (strain ATCC BAA-798 / CCMEE 7001 / YNP1) TaxID=525904 RepID=D1CGA0_THET1|nr:redox-sensing transcriptional repressor Rex [Thermobaculum terrenum]ACZ41956.1 CoA-binding domain protein [Thermobaculum terrenum ATCC BAA-798]
MQRDIPEVVIKRLPIYYRSLQQMAQMGKDVVSSQELAKSAGVTATQVRRDLSYFGEFGKQGKGYSVELLLSELRRILNLDRDWDVVLVGAGSLGRAVTRYPRLEQHGFRIRHVYDHNPNRINTRLNGLVVEDVSLMPEQISREGIRIAIIAVPPSSAQEVADELVRSGIKAILNYAPATIQVPDDVRVYDIDPVAAMQSLTYYLEPYESRRKRKLSSASDRIDITS